MGALQGVTSAADEAKDAPNKGGFFGLFGGGGGKGVVLTPQ